jgi:hypothetical protein
VIVEAIQSTLTGLSTFGEILSLVRYAPLKHNGVEHHAAERTVLHDTVDGAIVVW